MKKTYGLSVLVLLNIAIIFLTGQFFYNESLDLIKKLAIALAVFLATALIDLKSLQILFKKVKATLPEKKKSLALKRLKSKKHITNLVLSILCVVLFLVNYYYFRANEMLNKITFAMEPTELNYYVYVAKDSSITSLEDESIVQVGFDELEQQKGFSLLRSNLENNHNRICYVDFNPAFISPTNDLYSNLCTQQVEAIIVGEDVLKSLKTTYPDFESKTRLIQEITIPTGVKSLPVDVTNEPYNVLIMGVDIREDEGDIYSKTRTDTLMLVTFNPKIMEASIISIPRDSYVQISGYEDERYDKITHAGMDGVGCTIETVEDLLDIDINYYAKFNFNALVGLVDALGGIDVDVKFSFTEQDSNDNKGAISLQAGQQTLNGEQALAYARHRKTQHDHVRNESQQQVLKAILAKLTSFDTVSKIDDLFLVMQQNMTTNFNRDELISLISLVPKLKNLKMTNQVIDGVDQESYVPLYDQYLWITELNEDSLAKAKQTINTLLTKKAN